MVPLRNQSAFRAWVKEFHDGFDISWGKDGMGFGHMTLGQHDGGHYLDTETFGREFALKAFKAILGRSRRSEKAGYTLESFAALVNSDKCQNDVDDR
jgi:hypothetical protein